MGFGSGQFWCSVKICRIKLFINYFFDPYKSDLIPSKSSLYLLSVFIIFYHTSSPKRSRRLHLIISMYWVSKTYFFTTVFCEFPNSTSFRSYLYEQQRHENIVWMLTYFLFRDRLKTLWIVGRNNMFMRHKCNVYFIIRLQNVLTWVGERPWRWLTVPDQIKNRGLMCLPSLSLCNVLYLHDSGFYK